MMRFILSLEWFLNHELVTAYQTVKTLSYSVIPVIQDMPIGMRTSYCLMDTAVLEEL